MRELYACQLDLRETPGGVGALDLVEEWVSRGCGLDVASVQSLGPTPTLTPYGHEVYNALPEEQRSDPREWTCSWRRPDEQDSGLAWRILIASGPSPLDSSLVRIALRIRLEMADDRFQLAPLRHSFRSPAIIRTLLREHEVVDAEVRVNPTYTERRAADISGLVARLQDPDRQLPVFVVTRSPGPTHSVQADELARAVAGLAHVDVLSTHLAALALTDEVGRGASVWGGAVRLYWPNFTITGDVSRHRYWTRAQLEAIRDFPGMALSLLGGLAAARVPEHPVVAKARARARPAEVDQDLLPEWASEYIEGLEQTVDSASQEVRAAQAALADALLSASDLEAELASVRASFYLVRGESETGDEGSEEVDLEDLTVAGAFELAKTEASEHLVYLSAADESIAEFADYKLPRRLYEALTAISEAADAWQTGNLGSGFGEFFAARGYEFSKNNPAASARKTKGHYQRMYDGVTVTMEPHLKVDQSTTPDQCLRVYWYRDDDAGRLIVGHVGRHLPD